MNIATVVWSKTIRGFICWVLPFNVINSSGIALDSIHAIYNHLFGLIRLRVHVLIHLIGAEVSS